MAENSPPLFSFVSTGLHPGSFHVVRFRGQEGLSSLYRFEILLLSEDPEIDLGLVLSSAATFTIHTADGEQRTPYHGVLESFRQMHRVGSHALYRAVLVPKLWRLTLSSHNQVFLGQTPAEIIATCLEDGGLLSSDFDARIGGQDDPWGYVCQYNESHFQFFSRWAERYGYYYYFDQSGITEKLVVTDTRMSHEKLRGQTVLDYADISGLDAHEAGHVVKDFTMDVSPLPRKVKLKSYNYEKPDLDLQVEQEVDAQGAGEVYVYGQQFRTLEEGRKLASLRVQELLCRHQIFEGVSNIPFITPGYTFTLRGHYRPDCNQDYLITEVEHEGSQEGFLASGLGVQLAGSEDHPSYRNRFRCIPAQTQYRPRCSTVMPKISGTLHAKIDAASSGEYAELDDQGRYKVVMPFDLSGRKSGKASIWLRKAEPYAGSNYGMHFPLHKDTEVMLAFIDGDPNQPYIQSAMSNPRTPNVVNDATQTQSRIATAGGNRLYFEDRDGRQAMRLSTPTANSSIVLGNMASESAGSANSFSVKSATEPETDNGLTRTFSTNSESVSDDESQETTDASETGTDGKQGISVSTEGELEVTSENSATVNRGNEFTMVAGASESVVAGLAISMNLGGKLDTMVGLSSAANLGVVVEVNAVSKTEFSPLETQIHTLESGLCEFVNRVTGLNLSVSGQDVSINELVTKMDAMKTDLVGKLDTLQGDVTDLTGKHQELDGKVTRTCATKDELSATEQRVAASVSDVSADVDEVRGQVSKVEGTLTTTVGDVNRIGNSVSDLTMYTTLIAQQTHLI